MLHNWLPLYIEGEELASLSDTRQFMQDVKHFRMARWDVTYLEYGHCFYDGDVMTRKIVLAHDAWRPVENPYWYWLNNQLAECEASPQHCVLDS